MGKEVYCYAVPDYESPALAAAVEDIFANSAAAASLSAQSRVLLKPNLLAKHAPEKAVTTHPAVVAAVCAALCRRGVRHITLADSPGGQYTPGAMRAIYRTSGLAEACERYGAALYTDCNALPRKTQGLRVREFNLIEPVHEADFIIDLPKVKTHVMTGMSCAVKNLFGTIPGLQKAELHMRFPEKEAFGEMLVDLCEAVRPNLVIADGILAMEGDGPAGGVPRALGLVLGGEDAYTLDLAVCRLMRLPARRVPYLAAAMARGVCPEALDEALLRGQPEAAAPRADYRLPAGCAGVSFSHRAPRLLRWAVPGLERLMAPRPKIDRRKCIGCGKCAEICPGHTITLCAQKRPAFGSTGGAGSSFGGAGSSFGGSGSSFGGAGGPGGTGSTGSRPGDAGSGTQRKAHISPDGCIRCFCCHEMCPVKAIDVKHFRLFY